MCNYMYVFVFQSEHLWNVSILVVCCGTLTILSHQVHFTC